MSAVVVLTGESAAAEVLIAKVALEGLGAIALLATIASSVLVLSISVALVVSKAKRAGTIIVVASTGVAAAAGVVLIGEAAGVAAAAEVGAAAAGALALAIEGEKTEEAVVSAIIAIIAGIATGIETGIAGLIVFAVLGVLGVLGAEVLTVVFAAGVVAGFIKIFSKKKR